MFSAVNLPAVAGSGPTNRQLPICCVQRDQKMISLFNKETRFSTKNQKTGSLFI